MLPEQAESHISFIENHEVALYLHHKEEQPPPNNS